MTDRWVFIVSRCTFVWELNIRQENMNPDIRPVSSAYRSPLKVVVQRFVQQRPFAASLCAHQRDVDVIIRPCKPLVSGGNGHRVRGHGGGTTASGDDKSDGEQTSRSAFFLKSSLNNDQI